MIPRSARPFDASVLEAVDGWGAPTVAVAVVVETAWWRRADRWIARCPGHRSRSCVTACAVLAGCGGASSRSTTPAGPPGSTVRHLLAHAGGYGFDGGVLAAPGRTRIYSNTGFDMLGAGAGDCGRAAVRGTAGATGCWTRSR